jgi:hypothetical protein
LLLDPGMRFFYFNISFTFAATATPSFLSASAVRCKPSTPSVEITDPAFRKKALDVQVRSAEEVRAIISQVRHRARSATFFGVWQDALLSPPLLRLRGVLD